MLRNERAQLANLNSALLASPGRSLLGSPRMVGSPMMSGSPYLGAGLSPGYGAGAGLRRVRSFSSAPLGAMGLGHHHHVQQSPKVLPIPVPIPQQSPRPIVNYNVSRSAAIRRERQRRVLIADYPTDLQRLPSRPLASPTLPSRQPSHGRPRRIRRSQHRWRLLGRAWHDRSSSLPRRR